MTCPNCGHENPDEARFCANCGSRLGAPAEPSAHRPFDQPGGALPPRDLGALVSETFSVYGRNFWPFVLIAVLPQIPFLIAQITPLGLSVLLYIAGVVLYFLAGPATIHAVSQRYLGREIDVRDCYSRAWGRVITLILTFLIGAAVLIPSAILMIIIIGIPLFFFFLVSWFFAAQVIMLEGRGPIGALGRSRDLVRGSWWRVFGIGIVFFLILLGLTIGVSIPVATVGFIAPAAGIVLGAALNILLFPITSIGATLETWSSCRARWRLTPVATWSARGAAVLKPTRFSET